MGEYTIALTQRKIKNQAENLLQTLLQIDAGVFHNFNEQNFYMPQLPIYISC